MEAMLPVSEVDGLSVIFKIIGDPTCIRIMWALNQSEMCVCELAAALSMTRSAVSHQLKKLKEAKLVKFRREGKNVYYSLDDQHVTNIIRLALVHLQHE
jgi:ArsR family transcriptional regulator